MPVPMCRICTALLVVIQLSPSTAQSQPPATLDKPIAMIHGIWSNGDTWNSTGSELRKRLRVQFSSPTLVSIDALTTQAYRIVTGVNTTFPFDLSQKMPFVAHSQGGPVSRRYARIPQNRMNGLVTIGSPHFGAPIAYSANNYALFNSVEDLLEVARAPILHYALIDTAFTGGTAEWVITTADGVIGAVNVVFSWLCGAGLCAPWVGQIQPAVLDHIPGSAFHDSLVSTAGIENQVLGQRRISLVASTGWQNAMFKLLGDAWANGASIIKAAYDVAYLNQFLHYANHQDWYLQLDAPMWLAGMVAITPGLDLTWDAVITGLGSGNGAHDGFIPTWSQVMPGSQTVTMPDLVHTKQTTGAVNQIAQALLDLTAIDSTLGIKVRPPGSVASVALSPLTDTVSVGSSRNLEPPLIL